MDRPTIRSLAKTALEKGNPININMKWGIQGQTPLINAAASGDLATVILFLEHGADINNTDNKGNTALSAALFNGRYEVAQFLLDNEALRYISNKNGKKAVHCLNDNTSIARKGRNYAWPKNLLLTLQGECCICLDGIDEVGHAYTCGHVVHNKCTTAQCPVCRR